jgi:hypothetical protein
MAVSRRERVRRRAGGACEYCRIPELYDVQPFQIDHVRSRKHLGPNSLVNLAWSCLPCNVFKGPNVAGYDPETDRLSPLWNPRDEDWSKHFAWDGPKLIGLTASGRTTIDVLRINRPERIELRRLLQRAKLMPSQ